MPPKPVQTAGQQGRRRHVPQRTCVVCRRTLGKRELNRIVRTPEGVRFDASGKQPGRGAYLCSDPACWRRAIEQGVLARALKTTLSAEERLSLSELAPSGLAGTPASPLVSASAQQPAQKRQPIAPEPSPAPEYSQAA